MNWTHIGRLGKASLNGVLGDYLDKTNNPLATKMGFYVDRKPVNLNSEGFNQYPYELGSKLVIMIHGLTNIETIWNINEDHADVDDNYASRLYQRFGYTPFYLRYNTGLEILSNGEQLSHLMEEFLAAYPETIDEVMLIGFSMGGLLIRHGLHHGHENGFSWVNKVSKSTYIAVPHHGSPLEKFGNLASRTVSSLPKDYLNHWSDWIDIRSTGIKDLQHGCNDPTFSGEYTYKTDSGSLEGDEIHGYGFLPHIDHHFISGSVADSEKPVLNHLIGDTLVRSTSSLPDNAPANSKSEHFYGYPHLKLVNCEKVYGVIENWFAPKCTEVVEGKQAPKKSKPDQKIELDEITASLGLLGEGVVQVVNSVETVHKSIAGEPFEILEKVPVVKEVSQPIAEIHNAVTTTIYDSVRQGGKLLAKLTKEHSSKT